MMCVYFISVVCVFNFFAMILCMCVCVFLYCKSMTASVILPGGRATLPPGVVVNKTHSRNPLSL
uniref:Uncharacterized protein n=1 Tax=Octopus bimaculoides TaxID=37653 RepID=A0A0L8IBQ7_OCTBM